MTFKFIAPYAALKYAAKIDVLNFKISNKLIFLQLRSSEVQNRWVILVFVFLNTFRQVNNKNVLKYTLLKSLTSKLIKACFRFSYKMDCLNDRNAEKLISFTL